MWQSESLYHWRHFIVKQYSYDAMPSNKKESCLLLMWKGFCSFSIPNEAVIFSIFITFLLNHVNAAGERRLHGGQRGHFSSSNMCVLRMSTDPGFMTLHFPSHPSQRPAVIPLYVQLSTNMKKYQVNHRWTGTTSTTHGCHLRKRLLYKDEQTLLSTL